MSRAGQVGAEQRLDAGQSKVEGVGNDDSTIKHTQKNIAPAPEGIAAKADNPSGQVNTGHNQGQGGSTIPLDHGAKRGLGAGKDADDVNPKVEAGEYSAIRKEHQV